MRLETFAGWIAPIATMIAAMMTAANLGARTTGWGFVVFTVGSICWSVVGLSTGQTNLLATNAFLTFVNIIGVWRWLGRQRAYEDGGHSAKQASRRSAVPTLFTGTGIVGTTAETRSGQTAGKAVEVLIECTSGKVSYVVVATGSIGGIDEKLRAVPREKIVFHCDRLEISLAMDEFMALEPLAAGQWPASADQLQARAT